MCWCSFLHTSAWDLSFWDLYICSAPQIWNIHTYFFLQLLSVLSLSYPSGSVPTLTSWSDSVSQRSLVHRETSQPISFTIYCRHLWFQVCCISVTSNLSFIISDTVESPYIWLYISFFYPLSIWTSNIWDTVILLAVLVTFLLLW